MDMADLIIKIRNTSNNTISSIVTNIISFTYPFKLEGAILNMRTIKVLMNQSNYFSIGNIHVFINFNKQNLQVIKSLPKASLKKVHVFVTNQESINPSLKEFIDTYSTKGRELKGKEIPTRIIIHIAKRSEELLPLFKQYYEEQLGKIVLFVDKRNVEFVDNIHKRYRALIEYGKASLRVRFGGKGYASTSIRFEDFPYASRDGIFENPEERINPEIFKDKLIKAFKEQAPDNILKSFKTDDEIWDFIMQNAEWREE